MMINRHKSVLILFTIPALFSPHTESFSMHQTLTLKKRTLQFGAPLNLAQSSRNSKSLAEIRVEKEKELLEIGGDPFFLTDEDLFEGDEENEEDDESMPSMSLLAMGGISNNLIPDATLEEGVEESEKEDAQGVEEFIWNGEVDESAYFDYDE